MLFPKHNCAWDSCAYDAHCLLHLLADVNDVVEALRFAADNSLRAATYGAGHQVVGVSLLPNSVVIDTKNLSAVDVDPESQTAYVEAGMPACHVLPHESPWLRSAEWWLL